MKSRLRPARERRAVPPEDEARPPEALAHSGFWDGDGADGGRSETRPPVLSADVDKSVVVEALLFVSPEPLAVSAIAEITGFDPGAVREMLNRLAETYRERAGGMVLREVGGGFGFYAVPEAAPFIARLIRSQVNPRLTRAALETLAVVAYLQPVSRGLVAEIRGVHSEGVMKTLEDRGLVREMGRGGPPGYPVLYGTTTRFLERFGLNEIGELPELERFAPDDATIEKIKRSLSWEISDEEGSAGAGPRGGDGAAEDTENPVRSGDSLAEGGGGPDTGGPGNQER